ncbi:MAG TPA: hypothetical protein VNR66_01155 [Solirubrobacteraceae bacterium]|nr:hypothetical protein [Solirubrobacteraceae bacterium]
MSWKLEGSYFETCSCDVVCPCTASLAFGATHDRCRVDFEIEDIVPFGVQTGEPAKLTGIFHPAGSELAVAHATRSKIDAFGIQYDGTAAFSTSQFAWAA